MAAAETAIDLEVYENPEGGVYIKNFDKIYNAVNGRENPTNFRNLVKQISGKEITSVQAQQFLDVFEDDLKTVLTEARRGFIEKHFGTKNQSR